MPNDGPTRPPNLQYGERSAQVPPLGAAMGQARDLDPGRRVGQAAMGLDVPAWRQSWPRVLAVIAFVALILAALSWWFLTS